MTVQLWLGARVAPQVVAVLRKGHSEVMRRTVTGDAPWLVRVRVWGLDWPEVTWPKLRTPVLGMMLPVMARELEPMP